jgi:titin
MWTEVPASDNGGTEITGYKIEVSRSSSGPWTVLVATQTGATYSHSTGLMAGQTWYYQVSAINDVGTGAPATAMASTWKKPAAPAGFTAMPDSMAGNTTINLSWSKVSAPETDGDLDESVPYKLFATTEGAGALRVLEESAAVEIAADADDDKVGFQYVATGSVSGTTVAGGQTWHFQVAANNRAGIGHRSAVRVVKTWTLPGAPTGLMATAVSSTRVNLSWTAPTNTGGQGVKITGYLIERSIDSAATWPSGLRSTTTNANTTYADTNDALADNDTVHYRVSAMNGINVNGDTTGMASNIALAGALNVPTAPTKLKAAAVSGTQIDLSWTAPKDPDEAPVTGYKIEHRPTDTPTETPWSVLVADTESTGTTHMDMTLMNGELRHYQVSAINKAGTGIASGPKMATAWEKPVAPMMSPAIADSPSRIKLSWQPPPATMTGGQDAEGEDIPITGYKIEVSDDLGVTWSVVQASYSGDADASAEGVQFNHIGLMAGEQRHYQVSAINAVGESDPSNIVAATTDATPDAPGMPTMVMAMKDMDNPSSQINVSWMAPADTGGVMLSGYVLQRKSGDGDFMTIAASNVTSWWNALDCPMMNDAIPADATPPPGDDDSSPYCKMYGGLTAEAKEEVNAAFMAADYGTITGASYMDMGLERMTTYTYQVKAVNSAGASMWSEAAMATTDVLDATLMAPTKVMAMSDEAGNLTLTWEGAQNAEFYVLLAVDMSTVGSGNIQYDRSRVNDGAARMGNVTGLNSGTDYLGIVIAIKGSGDNTEVLYETASPITIQ